MPLTTKFKGSSELQLEYVDGEHKVVKETSITVEEITIVTFTYRVPATLVLTCDTSGGRSFARPKSDIFGVRSLSRSILLALMSR